MSATPLHGQVKPYKCAVCGKTIRHGECVDVRLICCTAYNDKDSDAAMYHRDETFGPWFVDMDWMDLEVTHTDCIG